MEASIATVSVIIPAYNVTRTLAETLESVVAQTRAPHEVIVVDDGSSDGTAELARGFAGRLPGLRIVSRENGGISVARNTGLELASGDLVAPLDGDDLWHPTYLERMAGALEAAPAAGLAYSFFSRIDMQSRLTTRALAYAANGWAFYRLLCHDFISNGSNVVMRRALVRSVGSYDPRMLASEDHNLYVRLAWHAPIVNVPAALVGYRATPGGMSEQGHRLMQYRGRTNTALEAEHGPALDPVPLRWARGALARRQLRQKASPLERVEQLARAVGFVLSAPNRPAGGRARWPRRWSGKREHVQTGVHFMEADPAMVPAFWVSGRTVATLEAALQYDRRHASGRETAGPPTAEGRFISAFELESEGPAA